MSQRVIAGWAPSGLVGVWADRSIAGGALWPRAENQLEFHHVAQGYRERCDAARTYESDVRPSVRSTARPGRQMRLGFQRDESRGYAGRGARRHFVRAWAAGLTIGEE